MKKLKKFRTFESKETYDINYEAEFDKVLKILVERRIYITMLKDTIYNLSNMIEKMLPDDLEQFMDSLKHYDEDIYEKMDTIKNNMIDGVPNLKDLIEEVDSGIEDIAIFLEEKDAQNNKMNRDDSEVY